MGDLVDELRGIALSVQEPACDLCPHPGVVFPPPRDVVQLGRLCHHLDVRSLLRGDVDGNTPHPGDVTSVMRGHGYWANNGSGSSERTERRARRVRFLTGIGSTLRNTRANPSSSLTCSYWSYIAA